MQIKDFRTIPLLAALIGASIGTAMYWRAPALYTSSSTILLTGVNFAEPKSGGRWFQKTLFPVNPGEDALRATTVVLLTAGGESGVVKISYRSRDAKGAQDAVKKLVAAAVNGSGDAGARGTVIETPVLPTTAQRHRSAGVVPVGAGLGLVLGTAFVVLRRVTGTPITEA
jgi:uncharacterized protein involved in exopolysaccharide biosynthesis